MLSLWCDTSLPIPITAINGLPASELCEFHLYPSSMFLKELCNKSVNLLRDGYLVWVMAIMLFMLFMMTFMNIWLKSYII